MSSSAQGRSGRHCYTAPAPDWLQALADGESQPTGLGFLVERAEGEEGGKAVMFLPPVAGQRGTMLPSWTCASLSGIALIPASSKRSLMVMAQPVSL
jgi:hypothetical protein